MNERFQLGLAAILALALAAILGLLVPRTEFATSVVDLLPGNSPEAEILRELADKQQGRILTVRLHDAGNRIKTGTVAAFLESLREDPAIAEAWPADGTALRGSGEIVFTNRYNWLLPFWLDEEFPGWRDGPEINDAELAVRVIDKLDQYLDSPDGTMLVDTVPRDPFLLTNRLLDSSGNLVRNSSSPDSIIWVRQAESPFIDEGQDPVFRALAAALELARQENPGLDMEYSGVAVFAKASKAGIQEEIRRLNTLGILFVLLVTIFWVRSVFSVLRIALVVVTSLLAAATAVLAIFPSVHVIALVIGSVLTGVAVDYGFHLVLSERSGLPQRSVTKAVIAGSVSSAMGFLVLIWTPLPFLKQVGVFVGAGLLAALLTALLVRHHHGKRPKIQPWQLNPFSLPRWTGILLLALLLPGLHALRWKDSINDLEYPLPALKETDQRLNRMASPTEDKSVFLVTADSLTGARDQLDNLMPGPDVGMVHGGQWIPTFADSTLAREVMNRLNGFPDRLREEMEKREYEPAAFAPFFNDWQAYLGGKLERPAYEEKLRQLSASLPGPLSNLIHAGEGTSWFMVLAPVDAAIPENQGVIELNQSRMLSDAFGSYRKTLINFAGLCLLALAVVVAVSYRWPGGLAALAIPLLAILSAYGLSGYTSTELTLFHVLGALLAFCMGLDYALFSVEAYRQWQRLPGSVSVSALTTIGVFGILSTSRIPAIQQLGSTVILVLALTLVLVATGWPFLRRGAMAGRSQFRLLPHGPEARYLEKVLEQTGDRIRVKCRHACGGILAGEWMIEAMAQSAAVLMAHTSRIAKQDRSGMLVVVQNCRLREPVSDSTEEVIATVEPLTDAQEGLLMFRGHCQSHSGERILEASFSIFIPPGKKEG